MTITAKAPCRVDLAGGTLDIWPLYLHHQNAVTVNFAVDRYTTCEITPRKDGEIHISSDDLKHEQVYPSLDALRSSKKHTLPLAAETLKFFTPSTGLTVRTHSESPAGAGISGSSALLIATCSALNKLTGAGYNIENIRVIAQNLEARIIRVPTGCQDYYPAMYGGVSAIELGPAGIKRVGLDVPPDELNARFVLAYTGVPRNSGINNWEVTKAHVGGDKQVHKNFDRIAAIAHSMRQALEKQDWKEVARLVREEWVNRKKNAPGLSTPLIDSLIEKTRKAGSAAAKVCGAGGGGCVLFLVEPDAKQRVSDVIEAEGATVLSARVAPRGVRIQTTA
jgi:D-glycero-alpha-D-manno-heptose-7-phosphate kinase